MTAAARPPPPRAEPSAIALDEEEASAGTRSAPSRLLHRRRAAIRTLALLLVVQRASSAWLSARSLLCGGCTRERPASVRRRSLSDQVAPGGRGRRFLGCRHVGAVLGSGVWRPGARWHPMGGRLLGVAVRGGLEFGAAAGRAEEVRASAVPCAVFGQLAVDAHAADGVCGAAADRQPQEQPANQGEDGVQDGGVVETERALHRPLERRRRWHLHPDRTRDRQLRRGDHQQPGRDHRQEEALTLGSGSSARNLAYPPRTLSRGRGAALSLGGWLDE